MRHIAVLFIIVGLLAMPLLAADATAPQPTTDVSATASASDQAKPAAEGAAKPRRVPQTVAGEAGGFLFRSLVGDRVQKKTGVIVENYIQISCARSSALDSTASKWGNGLNDPVVTDPGCSFYDISMAIHRDLVSNLNPQIGPVPGPVPKKFSWGFNQAVSYGRNGTSSRMAGIEANWSVNDPGSYNPTLGAQLKQNYLSLPVSRVQLYIPVFLGMELTFGRMPAGLGYEIPPMVRPGPNFFYSKVYATPGQFNQIFGALLSANLMRDPKLGYLMGEFGVNQGPMSYHPKSGKKNFTAFLHYRTPKMQTGIKAAAVWGPDNILPGAPCTNASGLCASNLQGPALAPISFVGGVLPAGVAGWGSNNQYYPLFKVISPRAQDRLSSSLSMYHNFGPKWRWVVDLQYGKQWGDGRSDTVLMLGPNHYQSGFTGGHWGDIMSQVTYQIKSKWSAGIRAEHFINRDGIGATPACGWIGSAAPGGQGALCKSNLNEVTFGVHYDLNKFVQIAPELRYDFQDHSHGLNAFGVTNLDVTNVITNGVVTSTALAPNKALSQNYLAHNHQYVMSINLLLNF